MEVETKIAARRAAVANFMGGLASWDEVEAAMAKMNLAWGRIRTGKALRDQPTIAHRQSIVDVDDRAGGTRPIVQSPYRFSQAVSGVRGGAPHKGEHTDEILRGWLGLSDKEIDQLAAQGILTRDTTGAD
jgi:crotonobetainyl-CoA:carnitine CoA-transferase CaiB-like acyl-CoA transferase